MSADLSPMSFDDLAPAEVPVSVAGKRYVLREASEDAACKYRNALLRSTKLGPEGKPSGFDGMADVEPLLVSLCLFERYDHNGEPKDRPVLLATVRGWPSRVVKPLFERAKEISALKEGEDKDGPKAPPAGGTDTSA